MLRINNLRLTLDDAIAKRQEISSLMDIVVYKYRLDKSKIKDIRIFRKAIDARHGQVSFIYNVDVDYDKTKEKEVIKNYGNTISISPDLSYKEVESGVKPLQTRPVIIGFGPSGIFASLILAKRGYRPIILEQGYDVDIRTNKWKDFLKSRNFEEAGSTLFGEGGAGTFSDGKLTTLVNDIRSRYILETFVESGANPEILYANKPHIGTDELTKVIRKLRKKIISLGAEIRFGAKVTNFIIKSDTLLELEINHKEILPVETVLLGIGHSSRETFHVLHEKGINIEQKPFAIGLRIEHDQKLINQSQYGRYAEHSALGAADYKLSYHSENGRTAYTFCMCPGGYVVPSNSEKNTVVTNGMSLSTRDNANANSALLVSVNPSDFPSEHPLAGVDFQKKYEELAFILAGKNYNAPVQLLKDFMNDINSTKLGSITPTYKPGYTFVEMNKIFPDYVIDTLKEAIVHFDSLLNGFAYDDAILTAPETRSSSPIRILRAENHESNIKGLYPMGEGAGYAGGIMSSAIDGIKTAEEIIKTYKAKKNV